MKKIMKKSSRLISLLMVFMMVFTMMPGMAFADTADGGQAVAVSSGYDIATGDVDSQGGQRVRATNINISGADVVKHQKTGDFSATVLLPADTDKEKELTFTLDCVGNPNITMGKVFVNNTEAGTMTAEEGSTTTGTWTYSMVPEWSEEGTASVAFCTQWNTIAWVTKTYTLNLRILGDTNTAPALKSGVTKENSVLIPVGESYSLKLDESAFWEDAELDDMTYIVSVNGAEPVEANGTYYQYGPEEPGETTLVFYAADSEGNQSEDTYTVKITAMNLTSVETGSAVVDAWNSDIKKIELGLADVESQVKADQETNTWYLILDSETGKEDKLFFRVNGSARAGRFQGVQINNANVDGAETDGTNFIWTATYTPEWNEYGEADLAFKALPQNDNKYIYTLKLKIANADNQKPGFKDGASKTDTVEQYGTYDVDVASFFADADDSRLFYSVSVNGGEYVKCDAAYSYVPRTAGENTLKFKAADLVGAESEPFTLTLNASEYELPEGSYGIKNYKNDGALLSMTILDADGEKIEGVSFTTGEPAEGSQTITVTLPGTMKTNDKVIASFHIVQNENGEPFLSTTTGLNDDYWNAAYKSKTDKVTTTLSQGKGTATVHWYGAAPEKEEDNIYDTYVINYQIVREDNQAPQLAENVEAAAAAEINQYESWSLDLSTIFTDAEGDELTYTVKVNDEEAAESGKTYKYEAKTDEDLKLVFQAKDTFGAVSPTYIVNLTVNKVHRLVIETGDPSNGVFGGSISYIHINGQETEAYSYVKVDDTQRIVAVQLKDTVADDAEVTIGWVDNSSNDRITLTPDTNPIKLVDGKATATIETYGNFFFETHYYYELRITNKANHLPALADGVNSQKAEELTIGEAYEVDLSTIFADADGNPLTYTVKINDGEEAAAETAYSFTPDKAGTYTLVFHAKDDWGASEESYTVTLTAKNSDVTYNVTVKVPAAVTPEFYISGGFAEDGTDILADELTAVKGGTENGWTSYTVAVPENISRISFRGTTEDGTVNWGGMTAATEAGMEPVILRQVEAVINTKIDGENGSKIGLTSEQAMFKVKYGENQYASAGDDGTDQYGYLYYRYLLVAADNSLIYTYYAEPLGDLTGSLATNQGDTKTVTTDSAEPVNTVLPLATKNAFNITAPSDAEVEMFRQAGYYNGVELIPFETIDNGDGTKTVVFNNVGRMAMFRVSKEGEITKAGYTDGGSITIDWEGDDRGPNYSRDYATVTDNWMASRGDDSMYVNVNYRNHLQLDVNEEFQLRAYRIWEIINTDTNNIMIEPDFHYEVLSGKDVISVTPYDGCSGNAKNNWLDIKGLKKGTAIIEVSYDAIDVISGDNSSFGNPAFTYNACDPARTALVVVQVGSEANDINFGIDANRTEGWDVEFDTLYFAGESSKINFKPTVISGETEVAKVEVSNDKGENWDVLMADDDGNYTAKIVSGNNILRVTTEDGTKSYQVVRGDKITVSLIEVEGSSDQDGLVEAGEKIRVQFNGVHNVIGKMSGIYNPTDYKTNFTYNGEVISGNGGQYTYPAAAYVELTLPGNAKTGDSYTLTNGNTTNGGWGSAGGAHRAVTGEVPPNLDAGDISSGGRNIFPEITITVGQEAEFVPESGSGSGGEGSGGEGEGSGSGGVVTPPSGGLDFGLSEDEIVGYVTVSFEDKGVRVAGEDVDEAFQKPFGSIISSTRVPFKAYDTIASVTLRLLEAKGYDEAHTGSEFSGFYLQSIKGSGTGNRWFGEFDAGQDSGWMITQNGIFIDKGASEFQVKSGDRIKWQYTCQLGKDIGDTYYDRTEGGVAVLPSDAPEVTLMDESGAAVEGGKVVYDSASKTLTITPNDGYELKDVKVNGVSKGAVTSLTGLKASDKVEVIFVKVETPEEEQEVLSVNVKELLNDLTPVARSVKTEKKNVKVTLKLDAADKEIIGKIEAAGYTVKYNFYRSTKKSSKYESMLIKEGKTYTNTIGKKNQMYYYKARVQVYDTEGKLIARTALKDCWYANRQWTK